MGGVSYTFKNQDWSYQIERVIAVTGEANEEYGLFLRLSHNGKLEKSIKCEEIK